MNFDKIFKVQTQRLYTINYERKKCLPPNCDIIFVPITHDNVSLVRLFVPGEYIVRFSKNLSMGDIGFYVMSNGEYIGFGWAKFEGSNDNFYHIKDCYLYCFFIRNDYRGKNIYPNLVSFLMDYIHDKKKITTFYIATKVSNPESIRGIEKLNFAQKRIDKFLRIFNITFMKKEL